MIDRDLAVLRYLKLATLARTRQQLAGCDRFLVLAGATACHTGWLDIANQCRALVLQDNPHHLLHRWDTMADALRNEEFTPYLRQQERFCSMEQAETLLTVLGEDVILEEDKSLKEQTLAELDKLQTS
ncbi:MAG: hypothetical protein KDA84_05855 [Planctomycetaceae bacterium]|nr:hypothetical protein [Planctomycetaceae bacterium]